MTFSNTTTDYVLQGSAYGGISGPAAFTKNGAGRLTIASGMYNGFTGAVTINGGILSVSDIGYGGSNGPIGASSNDPVNLTLNGGTLEYTEYGSTSDRGMTLGTGGGTLSIANGSAVLNLNGPVVGPGKLTVPGPGTLSLGNSGNTFAGGMELQGGMVAFNGLLGTGPINVSGTSTLQWAGGNGQNLANNMTIAGGVTTTLDSNGNSATLSGGISGAGGIAKIGSGTLTLTGANSFDGSVAINSGTINIQSSTALGSAVGGTTVAANTALELQGGITVVGESLMLNGTGIGTTSGALRNVSDNNAWNGPIILGSDTIIFSGPAITGTATGSPVVTSLTLGGTITSTGTASTPTKLTFQGSNSGNNIGMFVLGADIDLTPAIPVVMTNAMVRLNGHTLTVPNIAGGGGNYSILNGSATKGTFIAKLNANSDAGYFANNSAGGATINDRNLDVQVLSATPGTAYYLTMYGGGGQSQYTGKTYALTDGAIRMGTGGGSWTQPGRDIMPDSLTLDGGALLNAAVTATVDRTQGITLGAGGGWLDPTNSLGFTVHSKITGNGALNINWDTGTITLTNSGNDYKGGTWVGKPWTTFYTSGVPQLTLAAPNVLPSGASFGDLRITRNAGLDTFVNLSGYVETVNGLWGDGTIRNGGTLRVGNNDATSTFDGSIQNGAALTKIGAGTLTLTGQNTSTGAVTVSAGTLALTGSAIIATTNLTVSPGALLDVSGLSSQPNVGGTGYALTAGHSGVGPADINGSIGLLAGTGINIGGIGIARTLAQNGNLSLQGVNLAMDFATDPTAGSDKNDVLAVTGNLSVSGSTNTIQPTLLNGSLAAGPYTLMTYSGTLSGDATNFAFAYAGTSRYTATFDTASTSGKVLMNITGQNANLTWAGGQGANAWDLKTTGNFTSAATVDPTLFYNLDNVAFDSTSTNSPVIAGTLSPASVTVNNDATHPYTFSGTGSLAGGMTLTKSGSGTLILANNNTYAGITTINAGTLQVGNDGTAGSLGTGDVVNNGVLVFDRGDINPSIITITNNISGTGSVTYMTPTPANLKSDYRINGNNTYSGGTTISGVRVLPSSPAGLGTGPIAVVNGGQLYLAPYTVTNNISIAGIGWTETAGNLGAIRFQGLAGTPATVSGNITMTANSRLTSYGATDYGMVTGVIGDGGNGYSLELTGAGVLIVGGTSSNTYSGTTIINGGNATNTNNVFILDKTGGAYAIVGNVQMGAGNTNQPNLRMMADNQFGPGVVMNGVNATGNWARFDLQGTTQTLAGLNCATSTTATNRGGLVVQNERVGSGGTVAPATLILNGSGTYSDDGYIRDRDSGDGLLPLSLVWSGTGKQTFIGNQIRYTGTTTVSNGTLALSDASIFASDVTNTANLELTGSTAWTFSRAIAGTGSLTKTATNTITLAGNNTYTGPTNISAGTLAIGATATLPQGDINIADGAQLDASAVPGGYVLPAGKVLTAGHTGSTATDILGNVTTGSGTVNMGAGTGTVRTTSLGGNLSFTGSTAINYDLGNTVTPGAGVNDLVTVNGTLAAAGKTTLNFNPVSGFFGVGTYTLMTFTSGPADTSQFAIGNLMFDSTSRGSANTASLAVTPTALELVISGTAAANLTWTGTNATNQTQWDLKTTPNFTSTATVDPDLFYNGDNVTFDDTGATTTINLVGTLIVPGSVTINSSSGHDYTFNGG
ncbi:MAG: autotransporter-associated beta strand repeat-containing protein, partial [Tepidisphaeraceae bacterium]